MSEIGLRWAEEPQYPPARDSAERRCFLAQLEWDFNYVGAPYTTEEEQRKHDQVFRIEHLRMIGLL